MIDVEEADKAEVLMRLINRADNSGRGFPPVAAIVTRMLPKITIEEARSLLEDRSKQHLEPYFDYVNGRCLKINLRGSRIDERSYDENNGVGAAREALWGLIEGDA